MAVKYRGNIIKERLPGYPKMVQSEDDTTIEDKFTVAVGEILYLPGIGDKYPDDLLSALSDVTMTLRERRLVPKPGGGLFEVELIYAPADEDEGGFGSNVRAVYEYTTEDIDVPLAQHPNYQTKWNHVILEKDGELWSWNDFDIFWKEAVDLTIPDVFFGIFQWSKPGDSVPEGWRVIRSETKPGVESFRRGVVVITVTRKSRSKKAFERESKTDYTRQNPPKDFGHKGEWLRGGSRIYPEGKSWIMTVQYTNSITIDPDLYE